MTLTIEIQTLTNDVQHILLIFCIVMFSVRTDAKIQLGINEIV